MKLKHSLLFALAATLCAATYGMADEATQKTVAFRTDAAKARYVAAGSKGGLNVKGRAVTGNSTFVMFDLNGGELADGDTVNIKWMPSSAKPTLWQEDQGVVNRKGGKAGEKNAFKVRFKTNVGDNKARFVRLQTPTGAFVSMPKAGSALATSAEESDALTLEIVDVVKADDAATDKETAAPAAGDEAKETE